MGERSPPRSSSTASSPPAAATAPPKRRSRSSTRKVDEHAGEATMGVVAMRDHGRFRSAVAAATAFVCHGASAAALPSGGCGHRAPERSRAEARHEPETRAAIVLLLRRCSHRRLLPRPRGRRVVLSLTDFDLYSIGDVGHALRRRGQLPATCCATRSSGRALSEHALFLARRRAADDRRGARRGACWSTPSWRGSSRCSARSTSRRW